MATDKGGSRVNDKIHFITIKLPVNYYVAFINYAVTVYI
jgi:hypothetical protein